MGGSHGSLTVIGRRLDPGDHDLRDALTRGPLVPA